VLVVTAAPSAFAHATLEGTDPGTGANLERSPRAITLRFSEPVEVSLGSIRLFDARARRVDTGAPAHPGGSGRQVRAPVDALDDGGYVVTWRVLSADAHPVQGAFTFTVGDAAASARVEDLAGRLLAQQGGSTTVGAVYAVARWAVFAGLLLLVGGAAFLVSIWPEGRASRRATRMVWAGWWTAIVATVVAFPVEGVYAAALDLVDVFDLDVWAEVWDTRYGRVAMLRLVLLVLALGLLRKLLARPGATPDTTPHRPLPRWWSAAGALVGLGLVLTPGLAGHASTGRQVPLALVADVVHVAGVALWVGSLPLLAFALLPRADISTLRRAVPRYSQLALACVVAIVVSGVYQAWRQVGSFDELTDTDYGRLLLVKLAVVVVLVVVAAFSRDLVNQKYRGPVEVAPEPALVGAAGGAAPRRGSDLDTAFEVAPLDDATALRRLRRSVLLEVAIAVVVLGVTALLVNAPPAREAAAGPFTTLVEADQLSFDVVVAPAEVGPNDLHLTTLSASGGPQDLLSMEAQFSGADRGIAPIEVPLRRLAPGHYFSPGFRVPFSGDWELTITALVSETDQVVASTEVPIP
jgi:copper transport protein